MRGVVTPAANWPIGSRIILLDAWLKNPREAKVIRHWNADHIGAEDDRGIVYYAKTDRVEGFAKRPLEIDEDFADILG